MISNKQTLPLDKITGNHLAAIEILREAYKGFADKGEENLGVLELSIKAAIEKVYGSTEGNEQYTVAFVFDEVFKILNQKKEWNAKEQELYELFEKLVFLRAWSWEFKDFFQNMRDVVTSTIQLDFTQRVVLTKQLNNENNIFNYGAVFLNLIVSKMEKSVVSRKAINTMFNTIPRYIVIITNKIGEIRFINTLGEKLLKMAYNDIIGKQIDTVFTDYNLIEDRMREKNEISEMVVSLKARSNKYFSGLLTVNESKQDNTEIEELVFTIKTEHSTNQNKDSDRI